MHASLLTVLVLLLGGSGATGGCSQQTKRTSASPASPAAPDHSAFGVSLEPPRGWTRVACPGAGVVEQWVKLEPQTSRLLGVIGLTVRPPVLPFSSIGSLADYVASSKHKGQPDPDGPPLDGRPTLAYRGEPTDRIESGLYFVASRFAEEHGLYFGLYHAAAPDAEIDSEFERVAAGLRWTALKEPGVALAPRGSAVRLLATPLVFNLPDPFRSMGGKVDWAQYTAADLNSPGGYLGRRGALLRVTLLPRDGRTPARIRRDLAEAVSKNAAKPAWSRVKREPLVYATGLVKGRNPDGGKVEATGRLVMVEARGGAVIVLTFTLPGDPRAAARFSDGVEAVARSIREGSPDYQLPEED